MLCRRLLFPVSFFQGHLLKLDDDEDMGEDEAAAAAGRRSNGAAAAAADGSSGTTLLTEQVKPRQGLPPLLVNLAER